MLAIERAEVMIQMRSRTSEGTDAQRRAAFERFTQGRLERAYRLAGLILRDPSEAEDAVHDAVVQAWVHWRDLRDQGSMDAWFDRILVNGCRARMRRRTVRLLILADPPATPGPDGFAGLHERDVLHRALAALDHDHRIAVVLRYAADLSPVEIANRTGEREGTVKSRIHYALRQMRAALESDERAPGGTR